MIVTRNTLRAICIVCGTCLYAVYAFTGKDGVLVGMAGMLVGAGIDILREKSEKKQT